MSVSLQVGLKRRPDWQLMTWATPLLQLTKEAQVASLGLGTTPEWPPEQGSVVGP